MTSQWGAYNLVCPLFGHSNKEAGGLLFHCMMSTNSMNVLVVSLTLLTLLRTHSEMQNNLQVNSRRIIIMGKIILLHCAHKLYECSQLYLMLYFDLVWFYIRWYYFSNCGPNMTIWLVVCIPYCTHVSTLMMSSFCWYFGISGINLSMIRISTTQIKKKSYLGFNSKSPYWIASVLCHQNLMKWS